MGKKLIITEKPSVAQEFARVFQVTGRKNGYIENADYVITWCVGHLVEMVYPESYDSRYKKWRLEDLPFLPAEYKYGVIDNVRQQYEVVSHMLHREDIDTVYWAGDAGKEGQVIEENIRMYGGVREGMRELRVWIDSQTEEEIRRGIEEARPMSDYANLGRSGIMRSIEDYAMGINFSRAMSVKYGNMLNDAAGTNSYTAIAVGRVMTCVLGMVVIREREIRNFVETPFYRVTGSFCDQAIEGEWKAVEGSAYFESPLLYKENGFKKEADAQELIRQLEPQEATVASVEKGSSRKKAPLLFNLAELQAECAKRFKISPDETLQVAQDLYEKKLTTYPRTDARVLSTAVAKVIGKNLNRLSGYEPTKAFTERILKEGSYRNIAKTAYTDDSKVTDHYAIIPTGQLTELKTLNDLQRKVYDLIVRRFLSIFYPPAVYQTVKLTIQMGKERLFASAKILKEPGFLEVAGKATEDKDTGGREDENRESPHLLELAEQLHKGDVLPVDQLMIREGKTSPPKRYTSGSMVLAMENAGQLIEDEELRAQIKGSGIGTSATRAEIIRKLVRIGYIHLNKKSQVLSPERLGEMIYEVVDMTVPALLNPKMTASWEKGLDGITKGTVQFADYREKLEDFIRRETVSIIGRDLKDAILKKIQPFAGKNARGAAARRKIGAACPLCGGEVETTPFGYGCSNYKKDGSGCGFSIGTIAGKDLDEEDVKALLTEGHTDVLSGFVSKTKKKFSAALQLQRDEDGVPSITFDFSKNEPEVIEGVQCPVCGGRIEKTVFGYGCSNYKKDGSGCQFSIGKIADRSLKEEELRELLTKGRTGPLRGFTGKNKKKFQASLVLVDTEDGKKQITFDFSQNEPEILEGVQCPMCGGKIQVTSFGYGCMNYAPDKPDSCPFAIGKLAGKDLNVTQVKDLLTKGRTGTIRGFTSKTKKKFDACIALGRNEEGKTVLKFDFEHVEPRKLKDVKCPVCGGDIVQTPFGYGCANYVKDDQKSCRFSIGKIASVRLKEAQVKELLIRGRTGVIEGFVARTGMKFDAPLKLTPDGQVTFDFPEKPKPEETQVKCPKCGLFLKKSQWYYECECGFKVAHTVAKVALSESVMEELLTTGRTRSKVTGFTSRAGNVFDTCLKLEDDKITFDFDNPGEPASGSSPDTEQDKTKQDDSLKAEPEKTEMEERNNENGTV